MKMKRFYVILSAVALTLSASAQDINISGKPCVGTDQTFEYTLANRYDTLKWNFGDGSEPVIIKRTDGKIASSIKYTYKSAGDYTVKIEAVSSNETVSRTINRTINDLPNVDFSYDTTNQYKVFIFKAESGAQNYKWSFGDNRPDTIGIEISHTFSASGNYIVKLTSSDENGCVSSISHEVSVKPSKDLPNVFTPNGDGRNDFFMISCNEGSRLKLEIFNRWGYKMFSRSGTENIVWDGYNPQGTLVSPGTYFYVITVEEGTTNYDPLNGYITVYY